LMNQRVNFGFIIEQKQNRFVELKSSNLNSSVRFCSNSFFYNLLFKLESSKYSTNHSSSRTRLYDPLSIPSPH
jgi:hypothetical protein